MMGPRALQEWASKPGGKYFFIRNATTIIAFALGGKVPSGKRLQRRGGAHRQPVP